MKRNEEIKALNEIEYVYKFYSFDSDYWKYPLDNLKIYAPNLSEVNDPFEGVVDIRFEDFSKDRLRENASQIISREIYKKNRILCLSYSGENNPAMWAHYTYNYGYCLKIHFDSFRKLNEGAWGFVNYKAAPTPITTSVKNGEFSYQVQDALFVKHISWQGEKEVRLIKGENDKDAIITKEMIDHVFIDPTFDPAHNRREYMANIKYIKSRIGSKVSFLQRPKCYQYKLEAILL